MTQKEMILEYLKKNGSLTKMEGLHKLGIMNVGGRIGELRAEGHPIETKMIPVKGGKRVARYIWNG